MIEAASKFRTLSGVRPARGIAGAGGRGADSSPEREGSGRALHNYTWNHILHLPKQIMIKVIGIPHAAHSYFLRGPALAPRQVRLMGTRGSTNTFAEDGRDISPGKAYEDLGDMALPGGSADEAFSTIREAITNLLGEGDRIVSLGGDHSITYPLISGLAEKHHGLHVLHLDAHPDLYESLDGNPYSHASPFARLMERNLVSSLTQAGIRSFTPHQREQAARFGARSIEMKEWDPHFAGHLEGPLYLSLDMDVLDPACAPGVSHHEPGGLTTREVISLIQQIEVPLVGADIVELNPARDVHEMTAMAAYKLFKEIIAAMHRTLP